MAFTIPNKKIKVISLGKNTFSGFSGYPRTIKVYSTEMGKGGVYKTGLSESEIEELKKLPEFKDVDFNSKPINKKLGNFWSELEIRLDTKKGNEVDLSDPINFVKYKVMLASSKFCNSPLEKLKWPSAEWMIIDEEETAKVEAVQIDAELEASELFYSLSEEDRKGLVKLFGKTKVEKATPALIKTTLFKEMKKDPKKFMKMATDKSLKTRILLEELLTNKIITKHGNYYKNGDDPIGNSTDEAVSYLEDARNGSVRIALENKLEKLRK